MKNIFLLFVFIYSAFLNAQKLKENQVPAKVKEAFEKKFPGIKVEKWEKENINYEAEFDIKDIETTASFDENGICLETETEIKPSELPKVATDYLTKNSPNHKIKEASKITDQHGKITFEADVNHVDFIFDEQGHFLSKELNTEKD